MNSIRSILAATDFSDDATRALTRAGRVAAEQKAALSVLHVIRAPALELLRGSFRRPQEIEAALVAESTHTLDRASAAISTQHSMPVASRVRIGNVLAEIIAAAGSADLLVVGARGTSPVRDMIIGSTAERLLGKCTVPALVVKRRAEAAYGTVLVPVDFSPSSVPALSAAQRIAPDAAIHVCHAFEVPFESRLGLAGVAEDDISQFRIQARNRALAEIEELGRRCEARYVPVVAHGNPSGVILDKEAKYEADLIVIGKQGRSAVGDLLLGSVTRRVLADAKCDVLVVHR